MNHYTPYISELKPFLEHILRYVMVNTHLSCLYSEDGNSTHYHFIPVSGELVFQIRLLVNLRCVNLYRPDLLTLFYSLE